MRGRAARRAESERAKSRSRRTWREMDAQDGADTGRADDPRWVGMRATTRTFSSIEDRSGRGARARRTADINAAEQGA
jgi:hypothetical protein